MPVARGNTNSLVKEFMAFQTLWESQKNDPKSDTVHLSTSKGRVSDLIPLGKKPFQNETIQKGYLYDLKRKTFLHRRKKHSCESSARYETSFP